MPGSRVRVPPLLFEEPPGQLAAPGFARCASLPGRTKSLGAALLLTVAMGCRAAQAEIMVAEHTPQGGTDSVLVAAAGDLVCGSLTPPGIPCLDLETADVVRRLRPNALLLLGDLQYENGSIQDFGAYFDPAFGEFKSITYPVPGNHEYLTRGASGYFDYFNGVGADSGRAGSRQRGYYSFDLGAWHIVALNSNCLEIGGCGARSAQASWLRADLAAHKTRCSLAFMHAPRFTSGEHGTDESLRDLWVILHEAGVDVALAGHDHDYERFAPLDAAGRRDDKRGIRSFVVGTGGKGLGRFLRGRPSSEVRAHDSIGVLTLTLRSEDYSWKFVSVPPFPLADSGKAACTE